LLLSLFAHLKPLKKVEKQMDPSLTLIMAAYNEEACISGKLENSLALDYPREKLQILVADDGSSDNTCAIVTEFAGRGVELSKGAERRGKMAAITRAVAQARGEIIVFSDANNMYEPGTLLALVRPFADQDVGAVSGAKVILKGDGVLGESEGAYWKYESWIKKQETRLGSTTSATGEIIAMRRTLFQRPPDGLINDDFFMAMSIIKQGYRMVYAPDARSTERVSLTAQDEINRRTRINAGRYQIFGRFSNIIPFNQPLIAWQVISHKFMRALIPLGMIGAFLTNLALVIWSPSPGPWAFLRLAVPWNLAFLGLQMAFYLLALIGSQIKHNAKLFQLLYLPTFLVNSNFAALLGLIRYLTGSQTSLWKKVNRRN
jgi:cellulose synthase/poly-beta-1,6-N-acetylglucosamine synthase-like glycosyltransferase